MKKKPMYTIIKESGRAEVYSDRDYMGILSGVGHEYMSAGGNWDRPNMLLMNGKIVVEYGLADLAWKYMERYRKLREQLDKTMNEEFQPAWAEEPMK